MADRQQPAGHRLRRRYRGAHQRRCRGPRARPRARQASWLRPRADAAAQPAARHDRRRPALVRLVRLQRGFRAVGERSGRGGLRDHAGRHGGRIARLARDGEDPRRPRDLAGWCLRCRRRARGDHAGVFVGHPGRGDLHRPHRRCAVCPRGRPQVQAGLRRLARRRRRPPRRRSVGHPGGRPVRLGRHHRGRRRPVLRRRDRPALAAGARRVRGAAVLPRGHLRHRDRHPEDDRLPGHRRGRDRGHRQRRARWTAYDLASLGGGGGTSLVGQAHAEARNTEGSRV